MNRRMCAPVLVFGLPVCGATSASDATFEFASMLSSSGFEADRVASNPAPKPLNRCEVFATRALGGR